MGNLMDTCMLFPILAGVGGAIIGGFIVWVWQQLNFQNLKEQFEKQSNFLEKLQTDKDQLKKRHRDLQEKVSVLRTREYQLNEEINSWKEQFIDLENNHKSLTDNLVAKDQEIEVLKSSIVIEATEEDETAATLEENVEDQEQADPLLATPELSEEVDTEAEDADIEAMADSDGAATTEEGNITKVESDETIITQANIERSKLEQELLELRNEKEEEMTRWAEKYQQLQMEANNLQSQLAAKIERDDTSDLKAKHQQLMKYLEEEQSKYRLLEQEKLQLNQNLEKLNYEWRSENEELEQRYQQSQQELNSIHQQLETVVSNARAIELEPALAENWEERYKSVVAQFINAKERIRGLEQAWEQEKQHIENQKNEQSKATDIVVQQQNEYAALLSQFKASQREIDELNENKMILFAKLEELQEAYNLLSQQFKNSHQHIDNLQVSESNITHENAQLSEKYEGLLKQFKAGQAHIDTLEKGLLEHQSKQENLLTERETVLQEWSHRYNKAIKEYNAAIVTIKDLKEQQNQLKQENDTLNLQNTSITTALETTQSNWANERAQLENELAELKEQEHQKEQARLHLADRLSQLQQTLNVQINTTAELEQTITTLNSQQADWEQQLADQQVLVKAIEAEKNLLLEQYEAAKENQEFKDLYETLKIQQNDYQAVIAELEEELHKYK